MFYNMRIQQLSAFNEKGEFNSSELESATNMQIFGKISSSIFQAMRSMNEIDLSLFDNTTRANMLNNYVVNYIMKDCQCENFVFYPSLSNTRRSIGILNDEFLFLFKKAPVSNLKTHQDDLIKNQDLDKHVVFVTYTVDDFWSSITKVELKYYRSAKNLTYTYDITSLSEVSTNISLLPNVSRNNVKEEIAESLPSIQIKKELKKTTKKAE